MHPRFLPEHARRGYHHGQLKDALLDAARMLVAERGAAGFTLSEAAKLVGVTGAAPYRHFADRQALMAELARRGFDMFAHRLAGAWDGGRPDPVSALHRMGHAYMAFAREEPGLYGAMFADCRDFSAPPDPSASRSLTQLQTAAAAVLAHHGARRDGAAALALDIWAFTHGVAMLALAGHLGAANLDAGLPGGGDPA